MACGTLGRPFFWVATHVVLISTRVGSSIALGLLDLSGILTEEHSGEPATCVDRSGEKVFVRIGYDLFGEVQTLLLKGQPPANASVPALELHIAALRNLITGCGIPLVEIPPVPAGSDLVACLTHDVDHASIRRYKFDATMFGFLYRATVGSAVNVVRGRLSPSKLFTNWAAAARSTHA